MSSAELVAWAIDPEWEESLAAAEEFWEQRLGDEVRVADDPQFVRGFVEGALELWREVKDKL